MTMVTEAEPGAELPERWSAKAKMEQVLRLMRGEAVDAVSREIQVPAHELEQWRRDFLDGGSRSSSAGPMGPTARSERRRL